MADKETTATIKRGALEVVVPRSELISCSETADGLVFKFKYGILINIEDPNMNSSVKQQVCVADITFKKGSIVFDLNNYTRPVSLNL